MSLKSFYQTFYQHEQLYRLPGESFVSVTSRTAEPISIPSEIAVVEPEVAILPPEKIEVQPATHKQVEEINAARTPQPVIVIEPEPVLPAGVLPTQPILSPKIKQKVLLLADEALDPSSLLFLEKILNAVNLDITGVDLLNLHGVGDIDFAAVLRGKHIHHFITFGVPFERIGLDIMMDRYQPVRFEGITFLIADALPVIEANQKLKRALWESLKRVFSVKSEE
jgi:DNA polymerase III psi subunit